MSRKLILFCILLLAALMAVSLVQAQQALARPKIRGVNGALVGWAPVEGAVGYRLRWSKPSGNRTFKTVSGTTYVYTMTNLDSGATYEVQVRALGDGTNYAKKSKWSKKKTFTAPSNAPSGPIEFPRPSLSKVSSNTVSWDAVTGAKDYRVRWIANGVTKGKAVPASTTQYTINNLTPGVTYNVQVRARGDGVNYEKKGPWSGVVQL